MTNFEIYLLLSFVSFLAFYATALYKINSDWYNKNHKTLRRIKQLFVCLWLGILWPFVLPVMAVWGTLNAIADLIES